MYYIGRERKGSPARGGGMEILEEIFYRKGIKTMKTLVLAFKTNGTSNFNLRVKSPKTGLSLAEAQAAAAKFIPVLITRTGADVTELAKATVVTTSTEDLN